jgi:transcriptional regulator with XRE-family HTH domain
MMPRTTRQPTLESIARYGHIATLLRRALDDRGWTVGDLNIKLGIARNSTTVYPWLKGFGAPMPGNRVKLAKLLGVAEDALRARDTDTPEGRRLTGQPTALVVSPAPGRAVAGARHAGDVLAFTVGTDGYARIKLDVSLPLATATPLLRMLLDAGLVMPA